MFVDALENFDVPKDTVQNDFFMSMNPQGTKQLSSQNSAVLSPGANTVPLNFRV